MEQRPVGHGRRQAGTVGRRRHRAPGALRCSRSPGRPGVGGDLEPVPVDGRHQPLTVVGRGEGTPMPRWSAGNPILAAGRQSVGKSIRARPGEDVRCPIVGRADVLVRCRNDQCVVRNRHRVAKFVACPDLGCLEVSALSPCRPATDKYVSCTGLIDGLIRSAGNARRAAVFVKCADDHRVASDPHRMAKTITRGNLERLQISLLSPVCPAAREHVGGARIRGAFIGGAVDTRGTAVLPECPDDHRVARHPHRHAKLVLRGDLMGL